MVSPTPALDYWMSRTFCSVLDTTCQVTDKSMPSGREEEGQDETWRRVHKADRRLTVSRQIPQDFTSQNGPFLPSCFSGQGLIM